MTIKVQQTGQGGGFGQVATLDLDGPVDYDSLAFTPEVVRAIEEAIFEESKESGVVEVGGQSWKYWGV